ncbi:beta-N-acetylglucosaminidase domain-containing protein [Streptomyces sp. ODS28]|uniref:beta-N-acetylglucosaminidase domain-containing protein n=1 Tax=Streptomyces sp. ODS28 TaxID=3136688 RepID=UPI0031ECACBC
MSAARTPAALLSLALLAAAPPALASDRPAADRQPAEHRASDQRPAGQHADPRPLPVVSPTPQQLSRTGPGLPLPHKIRVVTGKDTDPAAQRLLTTVLRGSGVRVEEARAAAPGRVNLLLGAARRPDIARALRGTAVPDRAESYGLRVDARGTVALGGRDGAGQFYAVQTLRQLIAGAKKSALPGVAVADRPAMPLRGSIEGFYGKPWTAAERLDHMDFLGDTKANTYVYAPKDDPYHREKWREPYPAKTLSELRELVDRARANHVRFTFAVSPGNSICYSDPDDLKALKAKLRSLYDIGVRSFSIPLDDISYTKWNCAGDEKKFGAPGREAAAKAQVSLLNEVQRDVLAPLPGTRPLQTVPTEYGDLKETAYKKTLRTSLDKDVEVMWTGTDVVPPEITKAQAERASELFGRKVFVWDNYPVNDFAQTTGRLLLAPYDKREPGLSSQVSGLVSNPMSQAGASKSAVFTMNDFAWNDRGYDRERSAAQAARYLAGGDARTARAVRVFVDLNHLAPTFGDRPWQPQSPVLNSKLAPFWERYRSDPAAALRQVRPVADSIARTPGILRKGGTDPRFLADSERWLQATELWGTAMQHGVRTLAALQDGDGERAAGERAAMDKDATAASKIMVDPAEHHRLGPVLLGDPFIGDFLAKVRIEQEHG